MLFEQSNRGHVTAQCGFKPTIDYHLRLPAALRSAAETEMFPHWNINPGRGVLRNSTTGIVLYADHRLFQLQVAQVNSWKDEIDANTALFRDMLKSYQVADCEFLRLEIRFFADLGMTHAELVDLFTLAYLADAQKLSHVAGTLYDGHVRLYGKVDEITVVTNLFPMSAEDVTQSLRDLPNLEHFREDEKFDSKLYNMHQLLSIDSFCIMLEIVRKDVSVVELGKFFKSATDLANQLTENAVRVLKSLPPIPLKVNAN